jgi:hypothetical protein
MTLDDSELWNCFMGDTPFIKSLIPNNLYCSVLMLREAVDKSYMNLKDAAILWATIVDENINKKLEVDFHTKIKNTYGV